MAKRKQEDKISAAVGAAVAAGLTGPTLQNEGKIFYAPRFHEGTEVNLSSEPRSNKLGSMSLVVNGTPVDVQNLQVNRGQATFDLDGRSYAVELVRSIPETTASSRARKNTTTFKGSGIPGEISAPLPGIISELLCKSGMTVTTGQLLLRIEAMKMQNNVYADIDGKVEAIVVSTGEEVAAGQQLLIIVAA